LAWLFYVLVRGILDSMESRRREGRRGGTWTAGKTQERGEIGASGGSPAGPRVRTRGRVSAEEASEEGGPQGHHRHRLPGFAEWSASVSTWDVSISCERAHHWQSRAVAALRRYLLAPGKGKDKGKRDRGRGPAPSPEGKATPPLRASRQLDAAPGSGNAGGTGVPTGAFGFPTFGGLRPRRSALTTRSPRAP